METLHRLCYRTNRYRMPLSTNNNWMLNNLPLGFRQIFIQSRTIIQLGSDRSFKNRTRLGLLHFSRRRHATRDHPYDVQVSRGSSTRLSNGDFPEEKKLQVP